MIVELLIVFLLIAMNGFFAMAEIAVLSSRRALLKSMADDGHRGARKAIELIDNPSQFLSMVQTGVTMGGILAGAFSGATLALRLGEYLNTVSWIAPNGESVAMTIVVATVTYVTLFIGELVPKRIGVARAEKIACVVAGPLQGMAWFVSPVIWFLRVSTDAALRLIGLGNIKATAVTEDEVKTLIAEGVQEGVFEQTEKQMLEGVMRLTDRTVRSIMTPRIDMVWFGVEDPPEEIGAQIRASGYSRFPIARGDLDEVLGVVQAKDLLDLALAGKPLDVQAARRSVLVVPETTPVLHLLEQFKKSGQHQAIVVDEYGSVEGLVTVTDILVAIAGELPEVGQEPEDEPVKRDDGSWLFGGMMPIDEVEPLLGLRDMSNSGDYHTLAGFVLSQMGKIPAAGDHFLWQDTRFEVVDMDGRRIDKILVVPPRPENEESVVEK